MAPVKKLKIQMAIIDFPVLGSVFIYFDNPATLLILDIKIYPTIFLKSHIKVSHNEYIKFVKKAEIATKLPIIETNLSNKAVKH